MKLYIWEGDGVLEDYTSGLICVLAPDLEAALSAIRNVSDCSMQSFPNDRPSETIDLGDCNVEPKAWICWGGA